MAPAKKSLARPTTAKAPKASAPPPAVDPAVSVAAKRWAGLEPSDRRDVLKRLGNSVCDTPKQTAQLRFDELAGHLQRALAERIAA